MKHINFLYLLVTMLFLGTVHIQIAYGQHDDPFTPVKFEQKHTVKIKAAPKAVFELLGPKGSTLLGHAKADYIFGSDDELPGAIFRFGNMWLVAAEHNPTDFVYRYVFLIPGRELLATEYRLKPSSDGGTLLMARRRITGFNEKGNRAIKQQYENHPEAFSEQIDALAKRIETYLNKSRNSKKD